MKFFSSKSNPAPLAEEKVAVAVDPLWKVVVLDDPVNLMSYVVLVFRKILGFDEATARKHMLEVHEAGRSVVWAGQREKAEAYVYSLHEWHLSAVLERDETN